MIFDPLYIAQTRRIITAGVIESLRLKRTADIRTICGTNENQHCPFTYNTKYAALEVSLNAVYPSNNE